MRFKSFLEHDNLKVLADRANLDISMFSPEQVKMGLEVESEHGGKMGQDVNVAKDETTVLKIVVAHLREDPKYYTKLKKVEGE
jgi:hypothetical protein